MLFGTSVILWDPCDDRAFPGGPVAKNPPANTGDADSVPEWGRSPGGGNGYPLQYSCLGNPMDRGVWWATVPAVLKRIRHSLVTKQQVIIATLY